jgi:hypothetical protein
MMIIHTNLLLTAGEKEIQASIVEMEEGLVLAQLIATIDALIA